MRKIESLNLLWQLKEVNLFHCNYCKFFFQERSVPQQSLRIEFLVSQSETGSMSGAV